jgi:hypothetical protein
MAFHGRRRLRPAGRGWLVIGKYLLAGAILALSGQAMAAVTVIGNAPVVADPDNETFGRFGPSSPNMQTFGQVFTAPVRGVMTSFTLNLSSGLTGNMVGVLATWNGARTFAEGFGVGTVLYTSLPVAMRGGGAFTFTPDVNVTAGQRYIAYVTMFGQAGVSGSARVPLGDNDDPALDYLVWNVGTNPNTSPQWNYFDSEPVDALFTASFDNVVPEPQTWALMIAGFGLVGAAARRRRSLAAA